MVKKPKFNLMDCLIILTVIAVVAGSIYIIGSLRSRDAALNASRVGVRYEVEITNVDESFVNVALAAAEIGGVCFVGEKEGTEAIIKEASAAPCKLRTNNLETGEVLWTDSLNKYTVNLIIESEGTETETAITAGKDEVLKVGRNISVRGKGFAESACVLAVETFEADALAREAE